ncbi:hypothetical protein [Halapricum desulfuricans]|uniref:hypothetical protein n=1 Tax=Halapricum desulfuricans TaxID=2841257 RepID=UPI001E606C96|nr:hypothetical protein [Halapricum desulfuricans]
MQAPTTTTTTKSGSTGGQYHIMGQPASSCNSCPSGHRSGADSGGVTSTSTVTGDEIDVSTALASIFAPGKLDREDALLLWTGVNTVLFATLIYLEVSDG